MLGDKVARYLAGKHKPIFHPETDCGDHVVVTNCKDIAMHAFDWKHTIYKFNMEYPKSKEDIPAWKIHEYDPCRIAFLSVYRVMSICHRLLITPSFSVTRKQSLATSSHPTIAPVP